MLEYWILGSHLTFRERVWVWQVWLHGKNKPPQNRIRQTDKWNKFRVEDPYMLGKYRNKFSRQGEMAPAIWSRLPYLKPNKSSQCSSRPITWKPMLIFFSHLRLGLTSFLFPSIFPSNPVCNPFPCVPHDLSISYLLIWSLEYHLRRNTNCGSLDSNKSTKRCNSFLLDVYVWLNMFRASPRPSSGAYNCTRSLWFYRWRETAGALLVVCQTMTNIAPVFSLQR